MQILTDTNGKGVQFDAAVLTEYDLDRSLGDLLEEICEIHPDWSSEKALKKLNFGIKNTRQGECARLSEMSDKNVRDRLEKRPTQLLKLDPPQVDEALELVAAIAEASNAKMQEIYKEVWPNGSIGQNGQVLHGVELADNG